MQTAAGEVTYTLSLKFHFPSLRKIEIFIVKHTTRTHLIEPVRHDVGKERHEGPPDVKDRGMGVAFRIIGNDVSDSLFFRCSEDVCNLIIYFGCHHLERK